MVLLVPIRLEVGLKVKVSDSEYMLPVFVPIRLEVGLKELWLEELCELFDLVPIRLEVGLKDNNKQVMLQLARRFQSD